MEPPSRLPSPWAHESSRLPSPWPHESSPLPSPCPPPSPAVWRPQDWTPVPRRDPAHARSLPLIPSAQDVHSSMRANPNFSPLPNYPELLKNLHSHPMIIQRGEDQLRTPSPASSIELVFHEKRNSKPSGPVPFPMSSGFTSPDLCASPRPLPSVSSSTPSVRSLPSTDSSPARTPDLVAPALFPNVPPPPPLPGRIPVPIEMQKAELRSPTPAPAPARKSINVNAPRLRLPALRASSSSALPGARSQSMEQKSARHPRFYMPDDMIVLKVEGALYKVHRYMLQQHSDFFRESLSDESDAMGRTDDRPIPLPENVTQQAFDCLLSFLYSGIYDPTSVPLADWVSLLRISTHLQFTKVRQYAIRELTAHRASLPAVDAIVLAKEHDIASWLGPAYVELVTRSACLNEEEAERLGARTTAQVGRARETLRAEQYAVYQQRTYGSRYAPSETPDEKLVARAVNEVFGLSGSGSRAQ